MDQLDKQSMEIKLGGHGGVRPGAGRPPGSLNATTKEIRALAGAWGPAAIYKVARMAGLVVNDDGKAEGEAESEQVRLAALSFLIERGFGKATSTVASANSSPELTWNASDDRFTAARRVAFMLGRAVEERSAEQ